jgi:predicted mannosyl-3-phosphoglycerate phosphatase (HAD superfamily)
MREDMLKDMMEFQEELMIQNERIVELGQKLYYNQNFMERKFTQSAELDVRISALNQIVQSVQEKMD